MRKNRGFTAFELMITIAIVAILAFVGVPAIMKYIPKYKLGKEVTNLKADLEMSRLIAMRENICIGVIFDTHESERGNVIHNYTIFKDTNGCDGNLDSNESVLEFHELSPGIKIVSNTLAGENARFRGNGSAKAGTITLRNYGGTNSIQTTDVIISMIGRVRIERDH